VVIAVPILLLLVVVALLLEKGGVARLTAVLAFLVGLFLGDTGFGRAVAHWVMVVIHLL